MKKQSINDISARALLAFDELQKTLYDKSIRLVETGFSQFFASLINKSDLIDGIHIDDSLNVLPYKTNTLKLMKYVKSLVRTVLSSYCSNRPVCLRSPAAKAYCR